MLNLDQPRPRWWGDARSLAVASSLAALTAVTLVVTVAGRDEVATPTTAARVARVAVLVALPGLVLAAAAPRLSRRARVVGAVAAGLALVAVAIWQRHEGGILLGPAGLLAVAAARPAAGSPDFATVPAPARADLVVTAGLAAVAGIVGRALTEDLAVSSVANRLSLVASGLVLLAWPLVVVGLLPRRLRHRALATAAALLVAVVIARAPAGGEAWLTPAVVLLLLAAFVPPAEDEVPLGWF